MPLASSQAPELSARHVPVVGLSDPLIFGVTEAKQCAENEIYPTGLKLKLITRLAFNFVREVNLIINRFLNLSVKMPILARIGLSLSHNNGKLPNAQTNATFSTFLHLIVGISAGLMRGKFTPFRLFN